MFPIIRVVATENRPLEVGPLETISIVVNFLLEDDMATLRSPAKAVKLLVGPTYKSHDQLKGAKGMSG